MRELNLQEIKAVSGGAINFDWEAIAAAAAEYYRQYFTNYMWVGSDGGASGNGAR